MKRGWSKKSRIAFLTSLSLTCIACWFSIQQKEPEYGGDPASRWLVRYYGRDRQKDGADHEAVAAFKAIGPAGIIYLVETIKITTDGPAVSRIDKALDREFQEPLMERTKRLWDAFTDRLMDIKSQSEESHRSPLTCDSYPFVEIKESARDLLYQLQPDGELLISLLADQLHSPDKDVREQALLQLSCAGNHAEKVEPLLIEAIDSGLIDYSKFLTALRKGTLRSPKIMAAGVIARSHVALYWRTLNLEADWIALEPFANAALPILEQQIDSTDFRRKVSAAKGLYSLNPDQRLAKVLGEAIGSREYRKDIFRVLGLVHSSPELLITIMKNDIPDFEWYELAAYATCENPFCGKFNTQEFADLEKAQDGSDDNTRIVASYFLSNKYPRDSKAFHVLAEIAAASKDAETAIRALRALSELRNSKEDVIKILDKLKENPPAPLKDQLKSVVETTRKQSPIFFQW